MLYCRVRKADDEGVPVVDVDGSYLYRKYKLLCDAGENVSLPPAPPPPISGWTTMTSENHLTLASSLPPVTHGMYSLKLQGVVPLIIVLM